MSLAGATDRPNINIPTRTLSVFELSLTSDTGLDITLNGLGWSATLQFDIQRRESALAPKNLSEKLSVLGLREIPRVLPSRYRRTLREIMRGIPERESNLQEVQKRASLKRRRVGDEAEPETPATDKQKGE